MIARIFIPILLAILLPDIYIDGHYLRHRQPRLAWWKRLLWWMPALGMVTYTVVLASMRDFVPGDAFWIELYMYLCGIFVAPKAIIALCSFLGLAWCRLRHTHRNWGNAVGPLLALVGVGSFFYGLTIGFRKLEVKHVDLYFDRLPEAFDGYRIVHFSDAHVGMFKNHRRLLQRDIDSVNAQHADLVCFTGDLENIQPQELYPFRTLLASLRARDGVYSVLGNHDYSGYIAAPPSVKAANERELRRLEASFGWHLLRNGHVAIRRGADSIVVAGMENDGKPGVDDYDDIGKALRGVAGRDFVILLEHNPSKWFQMVEPGQGHGLPDVTLCGHTHAGQISVLGLRPTMFAYPVDYGLAGRDGRYLYVTSGWGGVVPFRLGATPEIAVITLHKKRPAGQTASNLKQP